MTDFLNVATIDGANAREASYSQLAESAGTEPNFIACSEDRVQ
jgi:hypothetical protein